MKYGLPSVQSVSNWVNCYLSPLTGTQGTMGAKMPMDQERVNTKRTESTVLDEEVNKSGKRVNQNSKRINFLSNESQRLQYIKQ